MTLKTGPNLGQLVSGALGESHYTELLRQWRAIDALVQPSVISRIAAVPTSGMADGDRYLITGATNQNKIARYSLGSAGLADGWEYFTPKSGWRVYVAAEGVDYQFSGSAWAIAGAAFTGGTLTSALNEAPIVTLASASSVAIGAAAANTLNISGTTAITAFDTIAAGAKRLLVFQGALTLTHNATSLILPYGANITTAAGDSAEFTSLGSGNWRCTRYQRSAAAGAKADLNLGNVDNTSDLAKPVSTAQQAALDLKIDKSQIGASDGVASLVGGKVPSAQLPSYVDDVLEYTTYSALPAAGESGKIYVTLDTNFEYRWSGSAYIQLVASPGTTDALVEGSSNLYFTQARVRATALTGIDTSQNAQITAADTVLAALGKAQGQIGAIQSALDTINGTVV